MNQKEYAMSKVNESGSKDWYECGEIYAKAREDYFKYKENLVAEIISKCNPTLSYDDVNEVYERIFNEFSYEMVIEMPEEDIYNIASDFIAEMSTDDYKWEHMTDEQRKEAYAESMRDALWTLGE